MARSKKEMAREKEERIKPIESKLSELDRQIDDLSRKLAEANAARKAVAELLAVMRGEPPIVEAPERRRASNVKGVVLDIMMSAGASGRTSAEVAVEAAEKIPGLARDTVSSVLSRLKGAGALAYDGLRYYEAKSAPKPGEQRVGSPHIRAVG